MLMMERQQTRQNSDEVVKDKFVKQTLQRTYPHACMALSRLELETFSVLD